MAPARFRASRTLGLGSSSVSTESSRLRTILETSSCEATGRRGAGHPVGHRGGRSPGRRRPLRAADAHRSRGRPRRRPGPAAPRRRKPRRASSRVPWVSPRVLSAFGRSQLPSPPSQRCQALPALSACPRMANSRRGTAAGPVIFHSRTGKPPGTGWMAVGFVPRWVPQRELLLHRPPKVLGARGCP